MSDKTKTAEENIESFIVSKRKVCWEAEFHEGEYAIGENSVKKELEKVYSRLETETIRLNIANNAYQSKLSELTQQQAINAELVEALKKICAGRLSNIFEDRLSDTQMGRIAQQALINHSQNK